jgi:hypothetical protein
MMHKVSIHNAFHVFTFGGVFGFYTTVNNQGREKQNTKFRKETPRPK